MPNVLAGPNLLWQLQNLRIVALILARLAIRFGFKWNEQNLSAVDFGENALNFPEIPLTSK
jgi:hypothetical protein